MRRRCAGSRRSPGPSGSRSARRSPPSLAAHDWLEFHDDDGLLASHLVVAPRRHRGALPDARATADPQVVLLRQGGGFGRAVQAGTALAGFVGACDGELVGRARSSAPSARCSRSGADAVAADVLPSTRGLVRDGILLPSS